MTAVCHEARVEIIHKSRMNKGESQLINHTAISGVQVLCGRRQSMPSSNIDNCARVRQTVPSVA